MNYEVLKNMKGEDIYYYLIDNQKDSLADLLLIAEPNRDKAFALLEKMIAENKKLVAIYPGLNEIPNSDMRLIGSIPDGALYLK